MSIKLGDHTVVIERTVEDWQNRDDYGNPTKSKVYRVVRWCLFTPSRPSEGNDRGSPAITGANLLAPVSTAGDVEAADAILYPWTGPDPLGNYTGRRWEVVGEVGVWDEAVDCQLRRLT